jgi:hypothetical protein
VTSPGPLPTSRLAVWGLAIALPAPLVGVFFSHAGHSATRRGLRSGRGLALWGIGLNYASMVLWVTVVLPLLAVVVVWLAWCIAATSYGAPTEQLPSLGDAFDWVFSRA